MLYTKIKAKIMVNGYFSVVIEILRSVRQGCPIAPLLYICVIESLLVSIRNNSNIQGIPSPSSNDIFLNSDFADDTNFFVRNIESAKVIIEEFEKFGKASGSLINKEKTEAIWLGSFSENTEQPLGIKWVKSSKT